MLKTILIPTCYSFKYDLYEIEIALKTEIFINKIFIKYMLKSSFTHRVRNVKFATYLKFATCENTNKINELW